MHHVHEFMSFLSAVLGDKRYSEMLEDPDFQEHAKKGDVTMCEVLDKVEQNGISKYAHALKELTSLLIGEGKTDEIVKAASDLSYAESLFKRYHISY